MPTGNASRESRKTALYGTGILLIGILIGILLGGEFSRLTHNAGTARDPDPSALFPPLSARKLPDTVPENGLDTVRLAISKKAARLLAEYRFSALRKGVITAENKAWLPATVETAAKSFQAHIRLKGDWVDHINTDKWSFRVKLADGKLFGMRIFSIQRPHTRGYLWEWLIMQAARMDDILAPRASFVNVIINNKYNGIYYLEEHFEKELLESQGMREGPIVCLDERPFWEMMQSTHARDLGAVNIPESLAPGRGPGRAAARAFEEKRCAASDDLARQLDCSLQMMSELRSMMVQADTGAGQLEKLRALTSLKGATIDAIFDTDALAKAHALLTLFQAGHGLSWHNQRYYHNPVTSRLAPVLFDCNPHEPAKLTDLAVFASDAAAFATSRRYYNSFFYEAGRYSSDAYLQKLRDKVSRELKSCEEALSAEIAVPDESTMEAMFNRLRGRQIWLHTALFPVAPVTMTCVREIAPGVARDSGDLVIEAWANGKVPVVVEGFMFGNGTVVDARSAVQGDESHSISGSGKGVVLPREGTRTVFKFPVDRRLAGLRDVKEIKKAIRSNSQPDKGGTVKIAALYHPVSSETVVKRDLFVRRRERSRSAQAGRPHFPSVSDTLAGHKFLRHDSVNHRFIVSPGTWSVDNDLLIPEGHTLHAGPGVTLRFKSGAVLSSASPVRFIGTPAHPVILEPEPPADSWGGVSVINAHQESLLDEVTLRGGTGVERGGWILTGALTFYHSSATIVNSRIGPCTAEDGMNSLRSRIAIRDVHFEDCASDAFDGDFVCGTIDNCTFSRIGGDAIDLCGSDMEVRNCRLDAIGDKAVSVGEESRAQLFSNTVCNAFIGVVSKDSSRTTIHSLALSDIQQYQLAAFIKKEEFGPSTINATAVTLDAAVQPAYLVQDGCTVTVDGRRIPSKTLNVDQLYRDKLLGK